MTRSISAPATKTYRWEPRLLCFVFVAVFSVASLQAQQPTPQSASQPASQAPAAQQPATPPADQQADTSPIIKLGVNEVNLIFTVADKHGRYIPNLQQSDFALLDDRKAPSKVTAFNQPINLPLRVGIVIDASTSIRARFQFEQQSATEFLFQIIKARSDRAFVMGFDVVPNLTQDWTNNMNGLKTVITRLLPDGGPALFDAVNIAGRDKLLDVSRGQEPVRKAMVL